MPSTILGSQVTSVQKTEIPTLVKITFYQVRDRQTWERNSAMEKILIMEIIQAMGKEKKNIEHSSEYFDKVFLVKRFEKQSIT